MMTTAAQEVLSKKILESRERVEKVQLKHVKKRGLTL